MKQNLTEMVFILDESGSMGNLVSDTIGGFNSMIENQKKEDGEAYVTTVLFNHLYKKLHDHVNLQDIQPMTNRDYIPCGTTALLDALGTAIDEVGARLAATPEGERPSNVVFVIITDGQENASQEYTKARVKEMIEHQQTKYSWVFMFLGANMDAVDVADGYGILSTHAHTYTADELGTASVYAAVDTVMCCARACTDSLSNDCGLESAISTAFDSIK